MRILLPHSSLPPPFLAQPRAADRPEQAGRCIAGLHSLGESATGRRSCRRQRQGASPFKGSPPRTSPSPRTASRRRSASASTRTWPNSKALPASSRARRHQALQASSRARRSRLNRRQRALQESPPARALLRHDGHESGRPAPRPLRRQAVHPHPDDHRRPGLHPALPGRLGRYPSGLHRRPQQAAQHSETLDRRRRPGLSETIDDASSADTGAAFGQDDSEFNIFNTDRQLSALETAAKCLAS
jgi:hypothetical protein